jgi:osmotically-inducible protein OsmY
LSSGVVSLGADLPTASEIGNSSESAALTDCRLTVLARRALQQESLLAPHNLGVSVRDRKAKLWGGVHSPDLSLRAEQAVRNVPGIASVQNDLRVEKPMHAGKAQLVQTWSPTRSDSPPMVKRRASDSLTSFAEWSPPTAASPPTVSLGLPIPREQIQPVAHVPPTGAMEQLKKLRDADARFRQVRIDMNGSVAHLRGTVDRWEDAFALAELVSRVPGVERVVLDQIATSRRESLQVP